MASMLLYRCIAWIWAMNRRVCGLHRGMQILANDALRPSVNKPPDWRTNVSQ
jgi:hypothetical protein